MPNRGMTPQCAAVRELALAGRERPTKAHLRLLRALRRAPKARSKKAKPVPDLPGHYSYTDAKGTKHIVNDFDKVPERYR